ncbi:helix-turn-helix domain-containing protein [Methanobrevibacter millerae]|uniref:Transcriptional regulator HxlR family n=1 Tax=Methanobrevibacter millerae TaxID=230361 RepID=A0A0U2L339_9EURY|nr:helix-turn-helix domain-containing protein [Methanobrevibacter millerae]ALT67950.1 transcriptional regulator HxlR family [Methanobrevibacter millerae]MBO6110617.1 helix-turn-helix transcriptional regulator [Methanobrevibacter sp.]MBO6275565.1 helix-turn-helix transcriptional regulator [Methanobrevibacter sp.]
MPDEIVCPVDRTLSLINKKWSIQIIRDLFFGKKHFKEFKEGKDISNKVLSSCLADLEKNGLIEKKVLDTKPISTEYSLTDYGKSMNRIIYELAMFTLADEKDKVYSEKTKEQLKENFKQTLEIDD